MENAVSNCVVKYKPAGEKHKYAAYLANFSNGCLKQGNGMKFKSYCSSKTADGLNRKKVRKILTGSTDRLDYSGANFGTTMSQQGEICKFALGVLNKKSNKMKLYDLSLMHLKPVLETTGNNIDKDEDGNYSVKVDDLTAAFGSKKKQRSMKSRIKYKVKDSDTTESVAAAVDEAVITEPHAIPYAEEEAIIPPRNINAAIEKEVYNLNDIITHVEYEAIEKSAKILQQWSRHDIEEFESGGNYSRYVLSHLRDNFGQVSLHTAKLLCYYGYLVQFYRIGVRDFKDKICGTSIPEVVHHQFVENFVVTLVNENGSKFLTIPSRMKNKIMARALLLALFVEEFEFEMSVFISDFKVLQNSATKLAYALGCRTLSRKINNLDQKVVQLRLPLYVPQSNREKKRKSRKI